jgi:hypothetical protein
VDLGGELRASYPDSAPRPAGLVPLTLSPGDFSPLSVHCGRSPNSPLVAPWGSGALTPLAGSFYALVGAGGQTSGWGGGAIQVSSTSQLRVGTKGLVNVNGTGAGSYWPGAETGGPLPSSSGGAVLLEAPVVIIDGQVAANGSGGACYTLASGVVVSGGFGGTSPDTAPALGGDAGTAWGGAGSAGDDPNGQPASPGCDARYPAGGGGAGWIAVKTRRCSITGTVSPSLKSGCANVMPLAAP